METDTVEIDYEAIYKELMKTSKSSKKMTKEIETLRSDQWGLSKQYYESKSKYDVIISTNDYVCNMNLNKSRVAKEHIQAEDTLNRKLQNLQQRCNGKEEENLRYREEFFNNIDTICRYFQNLQLEHNEENIHEKIKMYNASLSVHNQHYKKELKVFDELNATNSNLPSTDEKLDLKDITNIIRQESLEQFGDPDKIQMCLSRTLRNIELCSKKMKFY